MKIRLSGFISFVAILLVWCMTSMSSYATKLPPYILETLNKELPSATVRFDGLISLPNGITYLPVLPSDVKKNPSGKIVSTYPAGKKLSQFPDVVLFDSNFALLKVIKNSDGKLTVTNSKNIPFVVKTGIFPQDMLVPPGLVIPEDMQVMMGDLKIETVASPVNATLTAVVRKASVNTKIVPVPFMALRTLLATTLDSKLIYFIPSDSSVPLFSLEVSNLPKFIQPVNNDNYILVAVAGKTYIDVADVEQEVFAKKIDLGFQPTEIILNSDKTKAYVAVDNDQSIFVIDLKTMSLLEKIRVKGYPKHITMDNDRNIAYVDKNTGDVYTLSLGSVYVNKYVYNASNISKIVLNGKNLYLLSRTENNLQVIDTEIKDIIYKQPLAYKPVDMLLLNNNLYILCGSNQLDIFKLNDFSYHPALKLSDTGFSKKLVQIPNTNNILITNVTDRKYLVYDTVKNAVLQTVKTSVYINDLKIMSKRIK